MNIVTLGMQYLTPVIVGKLASALGINATLAQKAVAAALPAILAGFAGKAAQADGARSLFEILGKQDSGLLGNLANVIGSPQQKSVVDQGSSALGSLLGGAGLTALTGALGKFAGVGETATKGLLGALAPVALGTLAQQQKNGGLDASGIAKLLAGQKDNIASAIPGDFAKLLAGTGLTDSISANLQSLATPKPAAASSSSSAATSRPPAVARPVAARPAPSSQWWHWALPALLAVVGAMYMVGNRTGGYTLLPQAPKVMAGKIDIGEQLSATLIGLQRSLGSINDVASAHAALPQLRTAQSEIDRLSGLTAGLPADARKPLAGYLVASLPLLKPMIDQLLANTTIGPVVKPVLDAVVGRLQTMSKA